MESFDRETQIYGVFNDGGWPYKVSSRLAFWAVEGRPRVTLRDLIFSKIQQLHL